MKKTIITIVLLTVLCSSFAQAIVWKQLVSLSEGYDNGEAVTMDNELYFVTGQNDKSIIAIFHKLNPKTNQWIKLAEIPDPAINSWLEKASIPSLRNNAAVVRLNGSVVFYLTPVK